MVFNAFIVKKYAALISSSMLTTILFLVGNIYYGLFGGIGFMFCGLLLGVLLGVVLLKNPFTSMIEGKGILALNIDSTGIIRPFIVRVASPYVRGFLNKKPVHDVFDRNTVMQLSQPMKNETAAVRSNDGGLTIKLDSDLYNEGRFALFQYPVIIYNEQIRSIITKDFLATQEKDTFAEHGVLYLNRKMEELTSVVRDFGRHVVESLRPRQDWYKSKWVWIAIIVMVAILALMFAPVIISTVREFTATAGSSFTNAQASGAITPRG